MPNIPNSYAFIGLGAMGYPMAKNLVISLEERSASEASASSTFFLYDINTSPLVAFTEEIASRFPSSSVTTCQSPRSAAEQAQCIITIVPEGKDVEKVYLDPENGVLAAFQPRTQDITAGGRPRKVLMIDCSTIDVATSTKVAANVRTLNHSSSTDSAFTFVDAPVSGGVAGAVKKNLSAMVGIEATSPDFGALKSILSLMADEQKIFACGKQGSGLICKLSNNYLSGLCAIATSEAMNIGIRHGVDAKLLSDIFQASSGANWVNANCNPVPGVTPSAPPSHDYKGGFRVQLMRKDFRLATEAGTEVGANLALAEAGLAVYEGASEDPRCKDRDSRVVYRYLGGQE